MCYKHTRLPSFSIWRIGRILSILMEHLSFRKHSGQCVLWTVIFLSSLFWLDPARAATTQEAQVWLPVYLTAPLGEKMIGYFELNPRIGIADSDGEFDQLLVRPALGYQLTKTISLWLGYAWVTNYRPEFRSEQRIYQQLLYVKRFSRFSLVSRSRLEERIIQDAEGTGVRIRSMLRVNLPLDTAKLWAFVLYDEPFFNLTTVGNGPAGGFDQNRLFVGFNRRISDQIRIDLGYQNQIINTRESGPGNVVNHIALVQFFVNYVKW